MKYYLSLLSILITLCCSNSINCSGFQDFSRRYGPNSYIFNEPQYFSTRMLEKSCPTIPNVAETCEREKQQHRLAEERNARKRELAKIESERQQEMYVRQQELKNEQRRAKIAIKEQQKQLQQERTRLKNSMADLSKRNRLMSLSHHSTAVRS